MIVLGVVVALCIAGLLGLRLVMNDKAAARADAATARAERLTYDQKTLDSLPGRLTALEDVVKRLEWKAK